jgi:hypothetical protein
MKKVVPKIKGAKMNKKPKTLSDKVKTATKPVGMPRMRKGNAK